MEMMQNLVGQATQPARQHKSQNTRKFKVPKWSRFKLQFIHRNGQTSSPIHSFDFYVGKGGKNYTDQERGLLTLIKLVQKNKIDDSFIVATIWANITDDLRTYIPDVETGRLNMNYDFIVYKCVRGQQAAISKFLRFIGGKLDVEFLRKNL